MAAPDPAVVERQMYVSMHLGGVDDPSMSLADLRDLGGGGVNAWKAAKAGYTNAELDTKLSSKFNKSARTIDLLDYGVKADGITDDRASIQAGLNAGGVGATIIFPAGVMLLASFTLANDRILKTFADQQWIGFGGRFGSTLKVADNIGNYKTVVGLTNGSDYCGRWSMFNLGIDQNSANNALVVASMATYPRTAVTLGSYNADSVVSISECVFVNGDSVNTLYLYGDVISVSDNFFLKQGGTPATESHDHSSIYAVATRPNGLISISDNTFRSTSGAGGARTAIETHGGTQAVVGNTIASYFKGANLTGVSSVSSATDGIVCTGNSFTGVGVGIHLWAWYSGALPSGTAIRNVNISDNVITLDRDAWNNISGMLAYANGILIDPANTAPMESVSIVDNMITFLPISGTPPVSDYNSCGIMARVTAPAAELRDIRIAGNTIIKPLAAGINLNCVVKRGAVEANRVVDPGQSTEVGVSTAYRSLAILGGSYEDVGFERNILIDTRGTHYAEYCIIATNTLTSAINCWSRHNISRYADGVAPRCAFYPAASVAGAEFFIEETNAFASVPAFNTKVGSKVTRVTTGQVLVQSTAPVGTVWKTSLALAATVGTTSPTAGGAGALPATPLGYVTVNVNGTDRQIAYY